ncbi:MAG TPA: pyridoxal-dependent decarboxylase, partial [Solirubrobacteraceae bacterium]|nr:pyridoxal-dependent decarboxylase [Solirubrobacteraceae bacterium]
MSVLDDAAAEFRHVGHRLVDRLADYLEGIEKLDVFPDADPVELEQLFAEPLPGEGAPLADVVAELEEKLLPNCTDVGHPGYFGFITPSPLPAGALADLLASVLNQNPGAWAIGPGSVAMERRVVRWLCDLVGYDAAAGGNLTSGGMMANFIGLKLARDAVSGDRAQHEGVSGGWAVYTSDERHVAIDKAVDAVGLGRESLRARRARTVALPGLGRTGHAGATAASALHPSRQGICHPVGGRPAARIASVAPVSGAWLGKLSRY